MKRAASSLEVALGTVAAAATGASGAVLREAEVLPDALGAFLAATGASADQADQAGTSHKLRRLLGEHERFSKDTEAAAGELVGASRRGDVTSVAGAVPQAALGSTTPPLSGGRCIDATHRFTCSLCTAAPPADNEAAFELVGDAGKKNGEKKLRSLLARTPEWHNVEERTRLADAAEASGEEAGHSLAAVLRQKACSALRKNHLLFLSRAWGYKSDVWRRRDSRPRRDHMPPPQQLSVVSPTGQAASAADAAATPASLCEQGCASVRPFAGGEARQACLRLGFAHLSAADVDAARIAAQDAQRTAASFSAQRTSALTWATHLASAGDADRGAAWLALLSRETPLEELLRTSLQALHLSAELTRRAVAAAKGPAQRIAGDETQKGQLLGVDFLANCQLFLQHAKCSTPAAFLATSAHLAQACGAREEAAAAHLQARAAWTQALLDGGLAAQPPGGQVADRATLAALAQLGGGECAGAGGMQGGLLLMAAAFLAGGGGVPSPQQGSAETS